MSFLRRVASPNALLYGWLFAVTQTVGVLTALLICYVLQDFIWGFLRVALINSLVVGLALIGTCRLTERLIGKMRTVYVLSISFSAVLGVALISVVVLLVLEPTLFVYYGRGALAFLLINFLFITALLAISSGQILSRRAMILAERAMGAERELRRHMEMKLLSSRVNPHFLFNTLNMILTLLKKPLQAEEALLNLSDLLRENLEHSEQTSVAVSRELDNVRKYLEIQALRFGERLRYHIGASADFSIPPLIIQPLVENSIKHNINSTPQLTVEIVVFSDERRNMIRVVDSARTLSDSMLSSRGHGLTITKQRVENAGGVFAIGDGGVTLSFRR